MKGKGIYLALTLAMMCWGLNVIAIKVLVTAYLPLGITGIRILIAGTFVFLFVWWSEGVRRLEKKEWLYLILATLSGVYIHQVFLAYGLKETSGSNGTLILALNPLTTVVLAYLFLGEKLTWLRSAGVAFGLAGVFTIVLRGAESLMIQKGDLYMFFAMFVQSCSFLAVRKLLSTVSVNQVTSYTLLLGGGMLTFTGLAVERVSPLALLSGLTPSMWLLLFASALLATAFGGMIWNRGIQELGPGQTVIFINMTPFYGLLGSALFLGESIGLAHVIGFLFIVSGVLLGSGWLDSTRVKWKQKKSSVAS
ncbi:DMT family transporter [Ammoniphilus sp. YIM 78166]|uniref:DMT family transporter n=1 Tax=Ammoniphilus sp. YIM 78166 TaxID=1644106 RepID=UPI00107059A5|nr:DMT family transporter [Ammoniphilus sp. YIM 78166]